MKHALVMMSCPLKALHPGVMAYCLICLLVSMAQQMLASAFNAPVAVPLDPLLMTSLVQTFQGKNGRYPVHTQHVKSDGSPK